MDGTSGWEHTRLSGHGVHIPEVAMNTLLHIDASPRRRSFSRELSAAFVEAWRDHNPETTIVYRDLAAQPVPSIGEAWTELCDEVMRRGITEPSRLSEAVTTPDQRAAWAVVEPLLAELVAADVVVIGTPMHNYSIAATLKAWLDQVTFPG